MSLRCQKLFDSSNHILNLIHCLPHFRGKLVVLSCLVVFSSLFGRREVSYVRFSGVLERTGVCFFCSMSQTTPKKPTSRRERKPREATAPDSCRLCDCCFKTQFGNFSSAAERLNSFDVICSSIRLLSGQMTIIVGRSTEDAFD